MNLPPNQHLAKPGFWPVVGERTPSGGDSPWTLSLSGLVTSPASYPLPHLLSLPRDERVIDVHCVTRWSKPQMRFSGVNLTRLLHDEQGNPIWSDEARFVSFIARSARDHSTSLPLDDVLRLNVMLAFEADGQPISREHGGPMRMVVPGRYFYKSVKWIREIKFLATDQLGYWEEEAGYHNEADPMREQRYMAPTLSKQEAAHLIQSRLFPANRDLRGIDGSLRDLAGLKASGVLLRDARFRGAKLSHSDFRGANLSNAHFQDADLSGACFAGADLEGVDFVGADLRGADIRDTSLIATTFAKLDADGTLPHGAKLDENTRVSMDALDALHPLQRQWIVEQVFPTGAPPQ